MMLNDVHRGVKKHKKRQRIGRGPGSGHGKTSTRGHKGQRSRSGWSHHPTFQGGAMPVIRRIPKRGFNNKFALDVAVINTGDLEQLFEAGAQVSPETLREKSLVKRSFDVLKILGNGPLTKKLSVSAHRFSKSAAEMIEKAGGTVVVLPGKQPIPSKGQKKTNPNTKSAARAAKKS